MQSEFFFLCVKDKKRRKKLMKKRYKQNFQSVKSYLMQIFNYNIIMYEKHYAGFKRTLQVHRERDNWHGVDPNNKKNLLSMLYTKVSKGKSFSCDCLTFCQSKEKGNYAYSREVLVCSTSQQSLRTTSSLQKMSC